MEELENRLRAAGDNLSWGSVQDAAERFRHEVARQNDIAPDDVDVEIDGDRIVARPRTGRTINIDITVVPH